MSGGGGTAGFLVRRDGRERRVEGTVLRIGRGTDADVRFEDPSVALEHARVERRRDGWVLVDRGSVTGTYVDGRPVDEERLADGAVIDVGEHRLRVGLTVGAGPLEITVDPAAEAARGVLPVDAGTPAARGAGTPAGPAVTAPEIDYPAAYRLGRGRLSKAALVLGAFLLAALAVLWVLVAGRSEDFRPGALSAAHAGVIAPADCFACHTPWRGAMDANCAECHAPERMAHQAVQATTPACRSCHNEHQGQERISVVADRDCVACHGDLAAAPGNAAAPGHEVRFARSVTSFADHPPFSVEMAAARVPAAEAVDPTALKLNHALHLKPGLLGPEGRETLTCADCHELEAAEEVDGGAVRDLATISYEQHCQRCHLLNFDAALPPAPHLPPEELGNFLLGAYRGDRERATSVGQRRRDVTRGLAGLSRTQRRALEERARRGEYDLYRNHCVICHRVDLEATPVPAVTPPQVPTDWLPHARFSHATHLQFTERVCTDCHPGAAESTATADLLLPAIDGCLPCHGGGSGAAGGDGAARAGAASRCIDCHGYHIQSTPSKPG